MKSESFTDHIVFEKLRQFEQTLTSEGSKEKLGLEDLVFFETALLFINDRLKLTIPVLVQEAELTNLASEIEAGTVQINSYLGGDNIGHVSNAVNNLSSAINRVRSFPMLISKGDFDFSKVISNFQKTVAIAVDKIGVANKNLQEKLNATQDSLEDKNAKLAELQQQLANKEVEIQNVLDGYSNDFESIKISSINTFEEEIKKLKENVEFDRKSFKESIDTDREKYKLEYENLKKNLDNQTITTIQSLNDKLQEAKKIVNIVGNVGVTGNYQKIAEEHKKSGDFFRWVALAFMLIMSGLLIYSIIDLSSEDFDLYKSLVRILAASVLTYPAIYASRESTRHRNLETRNRNLELELASIGPFIELLPETKKEVIKEELVKKYFGQHENNLAEKGEIGDEVSINGLEKILKAILPLIKSK